MPDNIIPLPDGFVPISEPRTHPFYLFIVDGEVAAIWDMIPSQPNFEKLNAMLSSNPQVISSWDRIPEGYLYDAETGTFSAPE